MKGKTKWKTGCRLVIQHQLFHCCHCEMAHKNASFTELQEYLRKDQDMVEFRVSLDQLPDSGLEITAGQRTMSRLIVDLTGQTSPCRSCWPVKIQSYWKWNKFKVPAVQLFQLFIESLCIAELWYEILVTCN